MIVVIPLPDSLKKDTFKNSKGPRPWEIFMVRLARKYLPKLVEDKMNSPLPLPELEVEIQDPTFPDPNEELKEPEVAAKAELEEKKFQPEVVHSPLPHEIIQKSLPLPASWDEYLRWTNPIEAACSPLTAEHNVLCVAHLRALQSEKE